MAISRISSGRSANSSAAACRTIVAPLLFVLALVFSGAAALADGERNAPRQTSTGSADKTFSGNISWYGPQFNGRKTASGEIFDMNKKTAAHRTLAFSAKVMVEDPRTGGSVVVKVNDRGPFVKTRVMDISRGAASVLGTLHRGVCYVDCTVLTD